MNHLPARSSILLVLLALAACGPANNTTADSATAECDPGAFDAPGNMIDDDCNGVVDDGALACDQGLASDSINAMDFARAIDLCQTTTLTDKKWGVISAELTLADGTGAPAANAHAIRDHFGTGVQPKGGSTMALLSTGAAAGQGDTNPTYQDFQATPTVSGNNTQSAFPQDFLAAHGNALPNGPGCPSPTAATAMDPIMLTLSIRVPTNVRSFKLAANFLSSEFPEYMCSPYNDMLVVLLDSAYTGAPANPTDKNLAFFPPTSSSVGVNFASGPPNINTGLITQGVNGSSGCGGNPARAGAVVVGDNLTSCTGVAQLAGTGFDTASGGLCSSNATQGAGTGWMEIRGNVNPGEIIKLRIAIWDTSDHLQDSIALIDRFEWFVEASQPGTVIL